SSATSFAYPPLEREGRERKRAGWGGSLQLTFTPPRPPCVAMRRCGGRPSPSRGGESGDAESRMSLRSIRLRSLLSGACCNFKAHKNLSQRHSLEVGRQHDFQQLAIVGVAEHGVLDLRRLDPARAGVKRVHALALKLAREGALEHIDHLEVDVVV